MKQISTRSGTKFGKIQVVFKDITRDSGLGNSYIYFVFIMGGE